MTYCNTKWDQHSFIKQWEILKRWWSKTLFTSANVPLEWTTLSTHPHHLEDVKFSNILFTKVFNHDAHNLLLIYFLSYNWHWAKWPLVWLGPPIGGHLYIIHLMFPFVWFYFIVLLMPWMSDPLVSLDSFKASLSLCTWVIVTIRVNGSLKSGWACRIYMSTKLWYCHFQVGYFWSTMRATWTHKLREYSKKCGHKIQLITNVVLSSISIKMCLNPNANCVFILNKNLYLFVLPILKISKYNLDLNTSIEDNTSL